MHDKPWPWWVKLNLWGIKNEMGAWIALVLLAGLMLFAGIGAFLKWMLGRPITLDLVVATFAIPACAWYVAAILWVKKHSSFPNPATRNVLNDPARR
ncbi:MAG: hypothetical protein HONBIEJF_01004 [Fimbriimonadaceae bacterium]|nr:hypothetical protein [Fimbriimonadaceae bacterium]